MLLCPEIEGDGGEFFDQWLGKTVLGEIDAFDVGVTGVAALDADVREILGSVDGKAGIVFQAAGGAEDAPEAPFRGAQ